MASRTSTRGMGTWHTNCQMESKGKGDQERGDYRTLSGTGNMCVINGDGFIFEALAHSEL